jgi:hypothetical protein
MKYYDASATTAHLWVTQEISRVRTKNNFLIGSDPIRSLGILSEEILEVHRAALALDGQPASRNLFEELVQSAAICELWLQYLHSISRQEAPTVEESPESEVPATSEPPRPEPFRAHDYKKVVKSYREHRPTI